MLGLTIPPSWLARADEVMNKDRFPVLAPNGPDVMSLWSPLPGAYRKSYCTFVKSPFDPTRTSGEVRLCA
jgi:hypothetical protein